MIRQQTNDKKWLYQHSLHCSFALQLFLEQNPSYWCFIPMKSVDVSKANENRHRVSPIPISEMSASSWNYNDTDVHLLVKNVTKPPTGFDFSISQREQQTDFFKAGQHYTVSSNNIDLYDADIVAICMLRKSLRRLFHTRFVF
jgi:hypothetical protein